MTSTRGTIAVLATLTAAALTGVVATATGAQAATPTCGSTLAVTRTAALGAGGHGALTLIYRNAGTHACTLRGYPGLDTVAASGHTVAHASRTLSGAAGGATAVRTITVLPQGFASATVEWLNFNPTTGGACPASNRIATTPPNTTLTRGFPVALTACRLQIHPVIAGTSGNDLFARAQQYWIAGAHVAAAEENYYFTKAGSFLARRRDLYQSWILPLRQLISLPLTGLTPAQIAAARHDVAVLDSFFATPGLYS